MIQLLRTHTSAHQTELLSCGERAFLCSGDVYRRDEIDARHHPVFHQTEGVRVFSERDYCLLLKRYCDAWNSKNNVEIDMINFNNIQNEIDNYNNNYEKKFDISVISKLDVLQKKQLILFDLKQLLFGLSRHLFGNNVKMIWREDFFPFTLPSYELDVAFIKDNEELENNNKSKSNNNSNNKLNDDNSEDKWLEVLGCGVIHDDVMNTCINRALESNITINKHGWAFGLGLERLAMILFSIPDIRLFWYI